MVEFRQSLPVEFNLIFSANQNASDQTLNPGMRCVSAHNVQNWTKRLGEAVVISVDLRSAGIQQAAKL